MGTSKADTWADIHVEGQMSMWDDSLVEVSEVFPEPVPAGDFPLAQVTYLSAPDGSVLAPADDSVPDTALTEADLVLYAQTLARLGWTVFPPGMAPESKRRVRARTTDPETSAAAAVSVARRAGSQAHRLLRAYASAGDYGLTAAAAGHKSGLAQNPQCGYWKRCSELLDDGLLETVMENGQVKTRVNEATGEFQEVRRITRRGLVELARLNEASIKKESA